MNREISQPIFDRALKVLAKGVSSNFRYWGDKETPVIAGGKGAYITNADGDTFIDYRLGWGPINIGHGDKRINNAVSKAIQNGITFAATTELEVEVAEKIVAMVPGMELLRFTNTGTEATMHALRVARGYTAREKFIKFEGQYHGAHDYVLFSTASSPINEMGPRENPTAAQKGIGIPEHIKEYVIMLPFNDLEAVEKAVQDHQGQVAAMMIEPCLGNIAGLEPHEGYLGELRRICDDQGIVMIFDEVKTGFRLSNGGARETYGVIPDISTYAKSLGNGFPVAAFGGKKEVMDVISSDGVAHAGTFGANGSSMAAAKTVLDILDSSPVLEDLAKRGTRLKNEMDRILTDADIPHQMTGHPNMQGFLITDRYISDVRGLAHHDEKMYGRILGYLYDHGIWAEDDAREPWFLCESHNDAIIDKTLNIFADAVKAAKG